MKDGDKLEKVLILLDVIATDLVQFRAEFKRESLEVRAEFGKIRSEVAEIRPEVSEGRLETSSFRMDLHALRGEVRSGFDRIDTELKHFRESAR